jgi:ferredoxin-NADP reductase
MVSDPGTVDAPMDASGRHRIKELEVMVADVIVETPDTATLILFTGNDRLDYEPGHFLTIDPHQFKALDRFTRFLEDQKGRREPPRAYSLGSAPHEKHLAVTVKEEPYLSGVTPYPPLLSPLLARRTLRGTRMAITGFTGPYTLPRDLVSRTDHLVHLCAGSGIVPNYSIAKHLLHAHPEIRQTLLYANKTLEDIIYRSALQSLESAHPDRFRVVHALTRQEGGGTGFRRGRVSADLVHELVPDPGAALFYVCGPAVTPLERRRAKEKGETPAPRFLETVLDTLQGLGVPRDRIRHESYG